MTRLLFIFSLLLLAGCSSAPSGSNIRTTASMEGEWTPPAAGSIVAADSIKVTDDPLNAFYFSVRLSMGEGYSGKQAEAVRYNVHAAYGYAVADGTIAMPFGGAHLRPLLRKGNGYSYIMGFIPGAEFGGDTTFHEYYLITGGKEQIRITALKGYTVK